MKKFLVLLSLIAVSWGCGASSSLYLTKDPMTDVAVVTLDLAHQTIEGDLQNYQAQYSRKLHEKTAEPASLLLHFYGYSGEQKFDETGVIRIDGALFNVKVADSTAYDSNRSRIISCRIIFTPQIEQAMLNCSKLLVRLTSLYKNTTLQASAEDLAQIKKFLKVDYEATRKYFK